MWINQKGLIIISFRINAFRLWLPVSTRVLLELMYGFYELFDFFVIISGQSRKIRIGGTNGKYSTSLKDIDGMIASVIYFLDNAHNYEKFDLVEIDAGEKSNHFQLKISFL